MSKIESKIIYRFDDENFKDFVKRVNNELNEFQHYENVTVHYVSMDTVVINYVADYLDFSMRKNKCLTN